MTNVYLGKSIYEFESFVLDKILNDKMRCDGDYGCTLNYEDAPSYMEGYNETCGTNKICCIMGWASVFYNIMPWEIVDGETRAEVIDTSDNEEYGTALSILVHKMMEG